MEQNEINVLREAFQKSRRLLLVREMTSNLQRSIADPDGLREVLKTLSSLVGGEATYLLFCLHGIIFFMDFYSLDPDLEFRPPLSMAIPEIPGRPLFRKGVRESLIGRLPLASSYVYPFQKNGEILGMLEMGAASGQGHTVLAERGFSGFVSMMKKLEDSFMLRCDKELRNRQLRSLKRQLEDSTKIMEIFSNDSRDLIITCSADGEITSINPAGCEMLGYTRGEKPEKLPLLSPDLSFISTMLQRMSALNDIEIVMANRDGSPLFGLANFSTDPLQAEGPQLIYGVVKNITDRVKMQQDLLKVNMELEKTNKILKESQTQMVQQEKLASIGQLAAGVAHEINNPLAFVHNNFTVMQKYMERLSAYCGELEAGRAPEDIKVLRDKFKIERILADLQAINSESSEGFSRIMSIVRSLKDFSRQDSLGVFTLTDLNRAIENTLTVARNSWKYVAEVSTDFRLNEEVECMADQMNQVFLNIIVNSAQAIESQKRKEPGHILVETSRHAGKARIRISDDGPGIPEAIRSRIFEPFFTTKDIGTGTGLGLSICYDIVVEKHGGSLEVESRPKGGSSFIILLPFQSAAQAKDLSDV